MPLLLPGLQCLHWPPGLLLQNKEGRQGTGIPLAISITACLPHPLRSYCKYDALFPRICLASSLPVFSWFLFHCLALIFFFFPKRELLAICLSSNLASSWDCLSKHSLFLAQPLEPTVKRWILHLQVQLCKSLFKPEPISPAPFFSRKRNHPLTVSDFSSAK